KNDDTFVNFQQCLLKASIFMPPLYVGKADNLNTRCSQHISGVGSNTFHARFEDFARRLELPLRTVRQLVFVCVRTRLAADEDVDPTSGQIHELIEAIMKSICGPPYGMI